MAIHICHATQAGGWVGLAIDHLVANTDVSVGEVGSKFILQLASDNHWLWHNFTSHRVDLAGVDNLVVHCQRRSSNQGEPVGVVGHLEPEVIVSWNARTRVPCTLNGQGARLEFPAPFIW